MMFQSYRDLKLVFSRVVQMLLPLILVIEAVKATRIVQHPEDRVLFTSSLEETVVFVCTVENAFLGFTWMINGTVLNIPGSSTTQTISGDIYTDVLSFTATSLFNQTTVVCVADGDNKVTSNEATLIYQGLLDEPTNVSVSSGSSIIIISWSAPFSLDVTGVDPDIWYSVLIYNVTDETAASVPYPNCINISETFCVFRPDHLSPCHKYIFTVLPQNGVGNGTADSDVGYIHKVPPGIQLSEANISVWGRFGVPNGNTTTKYSVLITAPTTSPVLCFGELPEYFAVYFQSNQQRCPDVVFIASTNTNVSGDIWRIWSVVQLGSNCNYTVFIVSHNEAGEMNSTGTLLISTTVILVTVYQLRDEITVLCVFRHTLSNMCYVQLVSDVMSGFHEGQHLEGEGGASHSFTDLMSGTYTVLVYGLGREETSCSPPHDPDYVTVVSVTASQHASVTSVPVITHEPDSPSESNSHTLCLEGLGVGVGVGAVMTSLICVLVIIMIKVIVKCQQRKGVHTVGIDESNVSMKRNMAYELHNPRSQRTLPEQTHSSQTLPPIYEEL